EDDVRVLTQRGPKPVGERRRVASDLALIDDATAVPMQELDRVLDRENVLAPSAVDHVDQRRERGRLTRTGRPGDEHEASRNRREVADVRRQVELLERLDLCGDEAQRSADRRALEEHV